MERRRILYFGDQIQQKRTRTRTKTRIRVRTMRPARRGGKQPFNFKCAEEL